MSIPGAPNPADGLKEVANELKEKFDEAGMDKVDDFVDKLEEIKKSAAGKPKEVIDKVKGAFEELTSSFQKALDDPSSLAPPAVACVASTVGNAIVTKLKELMANVQQQIQTLMDLAPQIIGPMQNVGKVLESALTSLGETLTKLAKLPAEVGKMAADISDPKDIAEIEVAPMKKSLSTDGMNGPLDSIGGLKDGLQTVVELAKNAFKALMEFVTDLPNKLKNVFELPFPVCCVSVGDAVPALNDMLTMVGKLNDLPTKELTDLMDNVADKICNMDLDAVKAPVKKFAELAGPSVDKLEKTVQGAKMASNPAGAFGGFGK
jgi:hypothetical protein